ncbi:MAG: protein kinase [Alphaproteobacteria bacterium]|nr:protein kinase [Alphaproteobacteria bacterium]
MDAATPRQLGRYELVRVIGRGGMGVVYEAVMHGLAGFRKRVALKVLADDGHLQDEEARATLQREARLGALLSHPNLVSILDLGHTADQWYIAMELVDGVPVSALVREGPLAPSMVLDVGIMTCAGLAHIHGMRVDGAPGGLVHRDVKPQNLLVDVTGSAKLADFGVAALVSDRGTARAAGTPTWMSPEQHLGVVDHRSDLFSLGVVLYALATRRAPFGTGEKAVERVARADDIVLRPGFCDHADQRVPGLGEVLKRCLRLRPSDRWPDAASLGAALRVLRSAYGAPALAEAVAARLGEEPGPTIPTGSASRSRPRLPEVDPLFVGRDEDHARLLDAVRHHRVVTLTGPGGVGKTRLLLHTAATLATSAVPVVFADVSSATTGSEVARVVAERLGLGALEGDGIGQVAAALEGRGPTTLLLDGAESVARPLAEVLDRWLAAAPELCAVITSRVPLRSRHEHLVQLGPLSPDAAVELFVGRSGRQLEGTERDAARRLVRALDGLPLAIELAAARSRSMTPTMLLARMSERFRLLAGPRQGGARHATLEASIQVSWELLRPWGQAALGQLSVFAGGFALEAAEAVLDLEDWPEAPWAVDVLSELVDASLVAFDATRQRFALSHSVREFAQEAADDAMLAAAEVRHGEWYAQLGSGELQERANGHGGAAIRQALVAERDNLVMACDRALHRGDLVVAEGTGRAAGEIFRDLGPPGPGEELVSRVLALPDLADPAALYAIRASLRSSLGQPVEARADLQMALQEARRTGNVRHELASRTLLLRYDEHDPARRIEELGRIADEARALGEPRAEARARSIRGLMLEDTDPSSAQAEQSRAFQLFEQEGDERGSALAQLRLGRLDIAARRHDDALRKLTDAERRFRNVRDRHNTHTARENIAVVHYHDGRRDEARTILEDLVRSSRRAGYRLNEANLLANLAVLDKHDGRIREAWASAGRALTIQRSAGDRSGEARTLANMASLADTEGDRPRARQLRAEARDAFRALSREGEAAWHELLLHWSDEGPTPAMRERIERTLPELRGHRAFDGQQLLVEALIELGDAGAASEALTTLQQRITDRDPMRLAELDILRARIAVARGAAAQAAELLDDIDEDELGSLGRAALWMARAQASATPAEAADALDRAATHLTAAGAGPDSEGGRRLAALRAEVDAPHRRG